ncbi:MAG: glycine--tRNA ligase subunit alpha, partial [bacterium]
FRLYDMYEAECRRLAEAGLVHPAHDYLLKCSHTFNLLDARGAVGVTERANYIARVRTLARAVAGARLKKEKGRLAGNDDE